MDNAFYLCIKIIKKQSTMAIYFSNTNLGLSPQDPDYDASFNEEEEYERYLDALEEKGERERGN